MIQSETWFCGLIIYLQAKIEIHTKHKWAFGKELSGEKEWWMMWNNPCFLCFWDRISLALFRTCTFFMPPNLEIFHFLYQEEERTSLVRSRLCRIALKILDNLLCSRFNAFQIFSQNTLLVRTSLLRVDRDQETKHRKNEKEG